jgi:ribokinase
VDTVAAGDAFCGALAAALDHGQPMRQALTYASAAGALAVTNAGATSALPFASDVSELLARSRGDLGC